MTSDILHGIGASPGVVVGPAFNLHSDESVIEPASAAGSPEDELRRWYTARQKVTEALRALAQHARERIGPDEAGIFDAQREMAMDPELETRVGTAIRTVCSAEQATREACAAFANELTALDDPYLRLRADDIREVERGLLQALAGHTPFDVTHPPSGAILCAEALPAAVLVRLDASTLGGLVLGSGGATSHVAILARALAIPAVVGLGDALRAVSEGATLAVNGDTGLVYVNPTGSVLEDVQRAAAVAARTRDVLAMLATSPAITPDGVCVDLWANIGGIKDVAAALAAGATGVGLLRTEFLVAGRHSLPSEDEQYATYSRIAAALGGQTLVVRTFDIGGDKPVPALGLPSEANPFLGYRAIRIGLARPDLLRTQMRAILRTAEAGYSVWIMLPMVATVEEVRQARAMLHTVASGTGTHVPLGIMVEIPSAALNAAALAREVDFFSIGTNDLTQYTFAADRTDERLTSLYQPLHPAMLRLIAMTAAAAQAEGIPCGVCGELGGDPRATAVLLGLGVSELSMSAASLGLVKREVRRTVMERAYRLAADVLRESTSEAVLGHIDAFRAQLDSET